MIVYVNRLFRNQHETIGIMSLNNKILCHTLEDEKRNVKLYGETRIWAGTYKLKRREYGGHHLRYKDKFPHMHKGMIEICDVPDFTDILIHILNWENETDGCLGVGTSSIIGHTNRYHIGKSTNAYRFMYPILMTNIIEKPNDCYIKIIDEAFGDVFDGDITKNLQ